MKTLPRMALLASVLALALVLVSGWMPCRADDPLDLTPARVSELARQWEQKVEELEQRLDTLEYHVDFVRAALKGEYVAKEDAGFLTWRVQAAERGLEALKGELRQARMNRDILKAAEEDPAIARQLEKTLRARNAVYDETAKWCEWEFPGIWRFRADLLPYEREEGRLRIRAAQDEFDRQNAILGSMYRATLGSGGGEGGEGGGGGPCFPAGVLVLMADGSARPIETLRPGDRVLSWSTESGRAEPATVAQVRGGLDGEILLINGALDGGGLASNGAHRFYTERGLVAARDLAPGDVLTGRDGPEILASIERQPLPATAGLEDVSVQTEVYNITVEGTHTFYVSGDGRTAYLVHDDCSCGP